MTQTESPTPHQAGLNSGTSGETPAGSVRLASPPPGQPPLTRGAHLYQLMLMFPGTVIFLLFVLPLIIGVPLGLGKAFWKLVEPLFKAAGY